MATDYPVTMAVRALRAANVSFVPHVFVYEPRGGTRHTAEVLEVDEHAVVKTLIFEDDARRPLCVLMHGDREVSTKNLARQCKAKLVRPCAPEVAQRHSGYLVGGTSPFGLRKGMSIYIERSIVLLERVYINGGARGFLVEIAPSEIMRVLVPVEVDAALLPA
jgi:Cys-tRNA(Pro) deacylase